jgi:hypothetical protein
MQKIMSTSTKTSQTTTLEITINHKKKKRLKADLLDDQEMDRTFDPSKPAPNKNPPQQG